MVLVFMVVFLAYRVYQVVYPPEMAAGIPLSPPNGSLPEPGGDEWRELLSGGVLPAAATPPPPRPLPWDYAVVHRSNPFWYYSMQERRPNEETSPADLGLFLLDIQRVGERVRARIQTPSTTKWYNEGEKFEQFELISINADEGSVEVYAEQLGQRLTVKLSR